MILAFSFGQKARRVVMIEEFTNASCGPCAQQNPGFDSLLALNKGKIAAIKFHTWWPGSDPMYNHNTADVRTRVQYYGVSGVPYAVMDGISVAGSNYLGAPANLTQEKINLALDQPSPVTINLSYSLSQNRDTIYVTMIITAEENVSISDLKAQIGVVEQHIHFDNSAGANGETEFYDVMKKMLPNSNGTTLPNLAAGQQFTINQSWKMENIYDIDQVAVVAWVQNHSTKEVLQAAYLDPMPLSQYDAGMKSIVYPENTMCENTISPKIILKNSGSDTLTSVNIHYNINSENHVFQWTGNIPFRSSEEVTLPTVAYNLYPTQNILTIFTELPNGHPDQFNGNDTLRKQFDRATITSSSTVQLELRTDQYGSETSWELINSAGTILYNGGPYSNSAVTYNETFQLPPDCYVFKIYDSYGDGLGQGAYYKLFDATGTIIRHTQGNNNGSFGSQENTPFRSGFAPPTITVFPENNATQLPLNTNITLTFSESVKLLNNQAVTPNSIDSIITFKFENAAGQNIDFSGTINADSTVITLIPSQLEFNKNYFVAIGASLQGEHNNTILPANITFSTIAYPTVDFSPAHQDSNIDLSAKIILTFSEPVRMFNNQAITSQDIKNSLIFKKNNANGENVAFSGEIDGTNQIITLTADSIFAYQQIYYVEIPASTFEGNLENPVQQAFVQFKTRGPAPAVAFNPENLDTIPLDESITLTFNEPVRNLDNSEITNSNVKNLISLKKNNENVLFNASINAEKTVITISPSKYWENNASYELELAGNVENYSNIALDTTKSTFFTFVENLNAHFSVFDTIPLHEEIIISFNQPIRMTNDSNITNPAQFIRLRENNATGTAVAFTTTISDDKKFIFVKSKNYFKNNQKYYISVSNVENHYDMTLSLTETTFFTHIEELAATFSPENNDTIPVNEKIFITFNRPVRFLNNAPILNAADVVSLKNNASGQKVPFTAEINAEKTKITIIPTSNLENGKKFIVSTLISLEDTFNVTLSPVSVTFVAYTEPLRVEFTPQNLSTNISVTQICTLTFNQSIRLLNNDPISSPTDVIIFRKNDANGDDVPCKVTINSENTQIIVAPKDSLAGNQKYFLSVLGIENKYDIALSSSIIFTTERLAKVEKISQKIKIYPNPVSQILFVEMEKESHFTIFISDLQGKILEKREIRNAKTFEYNTSNLKNGNYFLIIETKNSKTIQKISVLR